MAINTTTKVYSKLDALEQRKESWLISTLNMYKKEKYLFLIFLPVLIYYIVFKYGPLYGIILAFKEYNFADGIFGSPWVGFANFKEMFRVKSFATVFKNTIVLSSYKMLFGFPAPIVLALLFNELSGKYFKKFVQTVSYLPYFLSWIVMGGIIIQLLSPSIGPIGYIFKELGLKPINFMTEPSWFRFVLVMSSIWKGVGWGSVIYLATIAGINPELFEAAIVDGSSRFQRIIHVTIPCLLPTITIMFILNVGNIIYDDFDQIFNLYNPAVYDVADVISTYTYRVGLTDMQYSYGTAVGLFRNIIALALVLITNTVAKRINEYSLW